MQLISSASCFVIFLIFDLFTIASFSFDVTTMIFMVKYHSAKNFHVLNHHESTISGGTLISTNEQTNGCFQEIYNFDFII